MDSKFYFPKEHKLKKITIQYFKIFKTKFQKTTTTN